MRLFGALCSIFLSIRGILTYDFAADFKRLEETVICDPECWFNASEITQETIELWPSECDVVCGIITINQNTNVTVAKLKSAFKKLEYLKGALRVDNTSLTNLSFFPNLFSIWGDPLGISITNNAKLTDIKLLYNVELYKQWPFVIVNNPKLDASIICEIDSMQGFVNAYVVNNLRDCGCRGENFGTESFADCRAIFGTLTITNVTDNSPSLKTLSKAINMTGNITISNTGLSDLSFLKIERFRFVSSDNFAALDLHDNPMMTRFAFDSLYSLVIIGTAGSSLTINIQNVHPDFCFTIYDMDWLTSLNTHFPNIEGSYCPVDIGSDRGPTLCDFRNMSSLANNCKRLMGRVIITAGDEPYVEKLKNVTHIFGSLVITDTNLTNVNFFANLERVALLNDTSPVIQIVRNPLLQNLTFPSLQYPFNPGNKMLIIQDTPHAFANYSECMAFEKSVSIETVYDGRGCYYLGMDVVTQSNVSREPPMSICFLFSLIVFLNV